MTLGIVDKRLMITGVEGMHVFCISNIKECLVRVGVVDRGLQMRRAIEVELLVEIELLVKVGLLVEVVKLVVVVIVRMSQLVVSKIFPHAASGLQQGPPGGRLANDIRKDKGSGQLCDESLMTHVRVGTKD